MEARASRVESAQIYSFFARKLEEFNLYSASRFRDAVKVCIYNHCVEDMQKNLVFMAETLTRCRIITIKPLSHLAYVVTSESCCKEN